MVPCTAFVKHTLGCMPPLVPLPLPATQRALQPRLGVPLHAQRRGGADGLHQRGGPPHGPGLPAPVRRGTLHAPRCTRITGCASRWGVALGQAPMLSIGLGAHAALASRGCSAAQRGHAVISAAASTQPAVPHRAAQACQAARAAEPYEPYACAAWALHALPPPLPHAPTARPPLHADLRACVRARACPVCACSCACMHACIALRGMAPLAGTPAGRACRRWSCLTRRWRRACPT